MQEHQTTKKRLGEALKELLCKHSIEKITVSDITGACGMGRQSFYYHFGDKYALLEWVIGNDLETYLGDCPSLEQWQVYTLGLLRHIQEDKKFYIRVVNAQNELFFRQYSTQLEKQLCRVLLADAPAHTGAAERLRFAARFFSYGFAGALVQWISEGMKTSPEQCIVNLHEIGMDANYLISLKVH